jgi:hypothetical protein
MIANGCGGVSRRSDSRVSRAQAVWIVPTHPAGGGCLCSPFRNCIPPGRRDSGVQKKSFAGALSFWRLDVVSLRVGQKVNDRPRQMRLA